jgi:hypothetical protein
MRLRPEWLGDGCRWAEEQGALVARVTLTDSNGNRTCASARPPLIEWSAAPN